MENFEFYDPNFNLNKLYYENLLKHIPEVSIEKCSEDEQIVLIDIFFKDSNFLEKLSKIQAKEDFPNFKDLPKVSIDEMKSKVENSELGLKSGKGFQEWTPEQIANSRKQLSEYLIKVIYNK